MAAKQILAVLLIVLCLNVFQSTAIIKLGRSRFRSFLDQHVQNKENEKLVNDLLEFAKKIDGKKSTLSAGDFNAFLVEFFKNLKETKTETDVKSFCELEQDNYDEAGSTYSDYGKGELIDEEALCSTMSSDETVPEEIVTKLKEALTKIASATGVSLASVISTLDDKKFTKAECGTVQTVAATTIDKPTLLELGNENALAFRTSLKSFGSFLSSTVAVMGVMFSAVAKKVLGVTLPGTYTGSVVTGAPNKIFVVEQVIANHNRDNKDLTAFINDNIKNLVAATPAGTGREIVLWPEYAITNDRYFDVEFTLESIRTRGKNFLLTLGWNGALAYRGSEIPPMAGQCDGLAAAINGNTFNAYTLAHLGCIAKAKNVFLVVNILMRPRDWGVFTYRLKNVNIFLAPDGSVVQVYEKIRPVPAEIIYVQPGSVGQQAQIVTLNGVEFVTMICFDLIFPEAGYKIQKTNFLFTTEWTSAREMLSIAFQQGFSRATKSNFFAANINYPDRRGNRGTSTHIDTGSGIYLGGRATEYIFGSLGATYQVRSHSFNNLAPAAAFDDDVDIHAVWPTPVKPPRPARKNYIICIKACTVQADLVVTHENRDFTLTKAVGELSCTLTLNVHQLPAETTNIYILQVDHSQSGNSFFKSKNRYVRSCSFVASPDNQYPSTSNYAFSEYSTLFNKVSIVGNNLAKGVAVIPAIAIKSGNATAPLMPMPANPDGGSLEHSATWSSWKKSGDKNTELIVKNTEHPIKLVSLYGIYDNQ